MGEQQYRPPGATGRIQINKMDQLSGIGRDANYNKAWQQPPLRLPGQLCCCHGARVCLRTSGNTNTSQKGKHGPEVPGGQGPRSQEEGGGYHSPARQRHLPVGTPKDHPVCVPRALGSHRPPGPRDPTSQRRPGEDWARAGGARERGARGRAGTGERFLPSGAAQGARSRKPRRTGAKVSLPAPRQKGLSPKDGSILTRSPLPTALLPTHSRAPDSPSPGYRWPAAPTSSAVSAASSSGAADPRPPPGPMAAGARVPASQSAPRRAAGLMLPGSRRGAQRLLLFLAGSQGPQAPPGRVLGPTGAARGLGR